MSWAGLWRFRRRGSRENGAYFRRRRSGSGRGWLDACASCWVGQESQRGESGNIDRNSQ